MMISATFGDRASTEESECLFLLHYHCYKQTFGSCPWAFVVDIGYVQTVEENTRVPQ